MFRVFFIINYRLEFSSHLKCQSCEYLQYNHILQWLWPLSQGVSMRIIFRRTWCLHTKQSPNVSTVTSGFLKHDSVKLTWEGRWQVCNRTIKAHWLFDYSLAGRTAPRSKLSKELDLAEGWSARINLLKLCWRVQVGKKRVKMHIFNNKEGWMSYLMLEELEELSELYRWFRTMCMSMCIL